MNKTVSNDSKLDQSSRKVVVALVAPLEEIRHVVEILPIDRIDLVLLAGMLSWHPPKNDHQQLDHGPSVG